jgi:acetyltransferase-like isoleucine patch superfamily enzyme
VTEVRKRRGVEGGPVRRAGPVQRRILQYLFRSRRFHWLFTPLIVRWDGGEIYSQVWRELVARFRNVTIGRYTYGPVFYRGSVPRGTVIGAWCSIGRQLVIRRRNHPIERVTQHPFFYNQQLGIVPTDTIDREEDNPLTIGNDVWIGDRVLILGDCRSIGNGAVVAGGSVVTKDVPAYAIVAGVPARILKERFPPEIQQELEASDWWELDLETIEPMRDMLLAELTPERAREFRERCIAARGEP